MKKIALILLCIIGIKATAQPPKLTNVLYGTAFYEEYMPSDRLEKDVQMMQDAGISVVRLGESTWSLFEPREGVFEFAWMDRIIDRLHKAGIKVVLGTPTYSMPAWLWYKHPEVLAEREKGEKAYYGIRQNMDFTNPTFLFYSERIIRKMMEHYAKHPAIIGYQVDNEATTNGVNNYDYFVGFKTYLKNKFKTTENLNKAWGLNFWGMTLSDWEELPPRDGITNPSYKVEWERYKRKTVADFLTWQTVIVDEYKRPDQFVMHCFMQAVHDIDQIASSRLMDIMAVNVYHGTQDGLTGDDISYMGNYFRCIKNTNYLVTETQAQTLGWDSKNLYPHYEGQLRLIAYSHLGSGANMVEYWHWHSIHNGQETFTKGILSHDLEPNRMYAEVSKTAHELKRFGNKLVNLKIKNKVAILYSHDSYFGLSFMPYKDWTNYTWDLVNQFSRVLYRNSIGSDIIFPEKGNMNDYSLVIVPSLFVANDSLLQKISDYVKNGGHVILNFKSGFENENSMVRPVMASGLLREACGFSYQEFMNIKELKLKDDPYKVGDNDNKVFDWAEYLIPETAKPLAYYDHQYIGKYPAITTNNFGKGDLLYEGTKLSDKLQEKIILETVSRLGIRTVDQDIQWPLVTKFGVNDMGKTIHYYYNFSAKNATFTYPHADGQELISDKPVKKGDIMQLKDWDVLIVEEK